MTESEKRYNSILDIIDKRLIPDDVAKGIRGEVFTPLNLVREMLFGIKKSSIKEFNDKVPKAKTKEYLKFIWGVNENGDFIEDNEERIGGIPLPIWRNPETKWLDPANGIGNFPVVAFYMLDYQLGKHALGENAEKFKGDHNKIYRRRHIVKNMLYMIELNKGNVNTSRKIFEKIVPGVTANIICANTLEMTEEKLKKEFGINRFHVIMGNPPFNEGGTKHHSDRGFYRKFIQYAYDILNKSGYIIYIHPPNYHRIDKDEIDKDEIRSLFNNNNLIFLRIIPDTKIYFDVQIAIDYYIIQKDSNKRNASILDKHNILTTGIDVSILSTIPNFGFSIIKNLLSKRTENNKFTAVTGRDSEKHTQRSELFKNGTNPIIHLINEDGIRIKLSKTEHTYQHTKKVIINGLGVPYLLDDKEGKYGVSEAPNYVLEPSKKEKIFLFSKLFQYLNWAYRIQGNKNDRYLFDILPDLNKFDYDNEEGMIKKLHLNNKEDETEINNNKFNVPKFPLVEKIEKAGEGKAPRAKKTEKKGGSRKSHNFTRRKARI